MSPYSPWGRNARARERTASRGVERGESLHHVEHADRHDRQLAPFTEALLEHAGISSPTCVARCRPGGHAVFVCWQGLPANEWLMVIGDAVETARGAPRLRWTAGRSGHVRAVPCRRDPRAARLRRLRAGRVRALRRPPGPDRLVRWTWRDEPLPHPGKHHRTVETRTSHLSPASSVSATRASFQAHLGKPSQMSPHFRPSPEESFETAMPDQLHGDGEGAGVNRPPRSSQPAQLFGPRVFPPEA